MIRRYLVAAALAAGLATPALAATHYYVVHSMQDDTCNVVEKKPKDKTWAMVGTSSYKTKDAADAAVDAAPECQPKAAAPDDSQDEPQDEPQDSVPDAPQE